MKKLVLLLLISACLGMGVMEMASVPDKKAVLSGIAAQPGVHALTSGKGFNKDQFPAAKNRIIADTPRFSIRGWESQLENFWCKWMGGAPDWFRNEQYLAYLRDAFSRAPQYHINTFMLMGRGDQGELHTFVSYHGWESLSKQQSSEAKEKAAEQAKVLEDLSVNARRSGVELYLWDHELQLPDNFAELYPEARGEGTSFCPSSPLVWRLLADKYEEFFKKVPALGGIVLVFAETKFNMLEGSLCHCNRCSGKTGAYFVEKIIRTASKACLQHNKKLFVRNFGHSWSQLETVLDAIRSVDSTVAFVAMSKMIPGDFFGLQMPPDPSTTALPQRSRILEDVVGGEFRGKTHNIVLPDEYYAKHLRHASKYGGDGAVFRLDHSAYPRSVFDTPNEFNVWLTSKLMLDPDQPLGPLWLEWTTKRYGVKAAPFIIKALQRTDDIWEHSSNSFGFYSTSAHSHIAPFFRGPYNAYSALWDVGFMRSHSSPEMKRMFQRLLNPGRSTLDKVVKEREQAVQWAGESLSALQQAKPHLTADAYNELSHYLQLQLAAAQLWRELGDLLFTGLAVLKSQEFPPDLIRRLTGSTDRALRKGQQIVQQFGRKWPVSPDADGRGTTLELAIAGLWGELLDRMLDKEKIEPYPWVKPPAKPFTWGPKRSPRSDAERVYIALLEAAGDMGTRTVTLEGTVNIKKIRFNGTSLIVENTGGKQLVLPAGITVSGPDIDGGISYRITVQKKDSALIVEVVKN